MSDKPRQPLRIPQIPPRGQPRRTATPMAERPDRDPVRPYVDHRASVASLARHMRLGLDMSKLNTTVSTHQLALILDTMLGVGFRGEQSVQFEADLQAATAAAMAAQQERAEKGDGEDVTNG